MSKPTQDKAALQLITKLGKDALTLMSLDGAEALSQPFGFTLVTESTADDQDLASLLETSASVTLLGEEGVERIIHGMVHRVQQELSLIHI